MSACVSIERKERGKSDCRKMQILAEKVTEITVRSMIVRFPESISSFLLLPVYTTERRSFAAAAALFSY